MSSMTTKHCTRCGVAVGPYGSVCYDCAVRPRPLADNCGVCGKNAVVTKQGVCALCATQTESKPKTAPPQRPSWDAIWMGVADSMSQRATCPRLSVGSVAVRDNQLLATAYNGAPRGLPHCVDVGCDMRGGHCVRAVHAEQNIVAQAAYRGTSLNGATLYTRHGFCVRCANLLIQAGIAEVVYVEEYANGTEGALDALRASGITVRRWR